MKQSPTRYYVVDVFSRRYYGKSAFSSLDEALVAARAIPRKQRPLGVWIQQMNARERVYAPIDDM
jgi:hypothetical protein